jgi:hypothetical protein
MQLYAMCFEKKVRINYKYKKQKALGLTPMLFLYVRLMLLSVLHDGVGSNHGNKRDDLMSVGKELEFLLHNQHKLQCAFRVDEAQHCYGSLYEHCDSHGNVVAHSRSLSQHRILAHQQ